METEDKIELLKDVIGCYDLVDEIFKYMSEDDKEDCMDYIARQWGVDFEEEEEEG